MNTRVIILTLLFGLFFLESAYSTSGFTAGNTDYRADRRCPYLVECLKCNRPPGSYWRYTKVCKFSRYSKVTFHVVVSGWGPTGGDLCRSDRKYACRR